MIDFRYHIVSIAAVFLALALGLVLGSTAGFQNNAISDLDSKITKFRSANNDLRTTIDRDRSLLRRGDDLVTAITPELIDGALKDESVAMVTVPGASGSLRESAEKVLTGAGATIASEVTVSEGFFDANNAAVLAGLVDRLAPEVPADGTAVERASRALAEAIAAHESARAGAQISAADTALLAGFREAKLVDISDNPVRASLVVIVAAPPQASADPRLAGEVTLSTALDVADHGSVVVGDEQQGDPGKGLVHAVRSDDTASASVSTVDDGFTAAGRLRIVRALVAERLGITGHYGTGPGAKSVIATPTPAP